MEYILLIFLLLLFGITPNFGFFSFSSFFILIGVFILFIAHLFLPKPKQQFGSINEILPFVSLISLFYGSYYYGGLYQHEFSKTIGVAILILFALTTTIRWFGRHEPPPIRWSILIYLSLSFLTLFGSPHPRVDTIIVLKEAPFMVLRGLNPYVERFSSVYTSVEPTYYNYLPMSFLLMIPFVYILNDPRYSIIVATLIITTVIFHLAKSSKIHALAEWLILFVLFLPRSFFMLEHIYLDPIIVSVFSLYLYFTLTNRLTLSYICLALFFSFKQTSWVTFPLFISAFFVSMIKRISYILAFLAPFIFPIYYFFLNPQAFTQDALTGLSKTALTSPVYNSLTVQTFFSRMSISLGPFDGIVLPFIILSFVYILILWKKPRLCYAIALSVFSFHFFSYHAFFNVYYFVALFLILDVATKHISTP